VRRKVLSAQGTDLEMEAGSRDRIGEGRCRGWTRLEVVVGAGTGREVNAWAGDGWRRPDARVNLLRISFLKVYSPLLAWEHSAAYVAGNPEFGVFPQKFSEFL
jgi:hypothetical protein